MNLSDNYTLSTLSIPITLDTLNTLGTLST